MLSQKRIGTLLGKYPCCSSALIKSQGNVIKAGVRHWFYLEDLFCRAYSVFFYWSLDVFLVINREMLLRILSKPAIQRSLIEQSLWKIKEKNAWGRLLFSKDSSSLSSACNFLLNKVFTILILSLSVITLTTTTAIIFWEFLMFYQIFVWPPVKRSLNKQVNRSYPTSCQTT